MKSAQVVCIHCGESAYGKTYHRKCRIETKHSTAMLNRVLAIGIPKERRIYVLCPWEQKDACKAAGAFWDRTAPRGDGRLGLWWFPPDKRKTALKWKAVHPYSPPHRVRQCSMCQRSKVSDGILVCRGCLTPNRRHTQHPPVTVSGSVLVLTSADIQG